MKNLFKSSAAFDLLDVFTQYPVEKFYLSDLAKRINRDAANVTRELRRLEEEGLITMQNENGKKYYSLNKNNEITGKLGSLFAGLRKANFDDRFSTQWLLAEDIPNMCPFFSKMWANCFVRDFASPGGRAYKKIAAIYKDYHLWFYFDANDANDVANHLVHKMVDDPTFMDQVNTQIVHHSDKLRAFAETVPDARLDELTNEQLWHYYKTHEEIHTAYYQWGWIPVAADMFGSQLTERSKQLLRDIGVTEEQLNSALMTLTQPLRASLIKIEQDELAAIGIKVQRDSQQLHLVQELYRKFREEEVKLFQLYEHSPEYERKFDEVVSSLANSIRPDILNDLQGHYTKYFTTKFLFTEEQGVYSFEHFLKSLVRMVNNTPDIAAALQKEEQETRDQQQVRDALITSLNLTPKLRQFFDAWGEFMVTKIYRRYAQIFALYRMVPIIEEIGRRFGLTIKETKFMTKEEVERGLFHNEVPTSVIRARVPFSVYYADADSYAFYSGKEAEQAAASIQNEKEFGQLSEIQGQCGCQGVARGTVRIVNVIAEMDKVKPGDILVSISTQPDLLPAMKKAAAFVTEQGGVTSHAAIVAREMKKPCVIGTKIATKVLKDGMTVEVDATKGVVRIIE